MSCWAILEVVAIYDFNFTIVNFQLGGYAVEFEYLFVSLTLLLFLECIYVFICVLGYLPPIIFRYFIIALLGTPRLIDCVAFYISVANYKFEVWYPESTWPSSIYPPSVRRSLVIFFSLMVRWRWNLRCLFIAFSLAHEALRPFLGHSVCVSLSIW